MHEDDLTRRVVDALHVEPESPQFFDELQRRLETGDRAAVRRWRRAAIAFALAALAATVAAGVLAAAPHAAANVVDRTVACSNLVHGAGGPFFDVTTQPGSPEPGSTGQLPKTLPKGFAPIPAIQLQSGESLILLLLSPYMSGYQLDRTRCAPLRHVPKLTPHGLPKVGALGADAAAVNELHERCAVGKMVMRIHIVSDGNGIPLTAQLLIVRAATGRPIVFIDWARKHTTAYASSAGCVQMQ